jgi:cystathionine beta-lyase
VSEPVAVDPFDDVSLELLRARRSAKWTKYPADVLPAWVAEMDFALALPIREVLQTAIARDDTGYPDLGRLPDAFVDFAESRFGWTVDAAQVRLVADVMSAVEALLRAFTEPGDAVVVNPPVYPPFFGVTREVGRTVAEAPLAADSSLDLDAVESAFAAGARAYLLCNPHNPTGRSCTRAELEEIAALAGRYGAIVISDEVHAPMTLPGATHVPYLSLGGVAAEHGVVVSSASKTWNLAGLKCAVILSGSETMDGRLAAGLPVHLAYHTGHFGVLAGTAAFEHGAEWLDALLVHLDRNRRLLGDLLEERLPGVGYAPPQAGYLAWLDFRALGLSDDPSVDLLERGRVALSPGPTFGTQGTGFARLNIGTSSALLDEAVRRMAAAVG